MINIKNNVNTGKRISTERKKSALTQAELANKVHVTRQAVSNWERNITVPDKSMVAKLANIFGTNIDDFMRRDKMVKDEKDYNYEPSKYDTAIGLFYAIGLFIGILFAVFMIFINPINVKNIIFAVIFGGLIFLIFGLISHAMITLCRKD